jgi:two-component system NarL family sensor kinase
MKKYFTILLLFSICSYAQRFNSLNNDQKFIDSISNIIKSTKSDSIKSFYSFKISDLHRRNGNLKKFEYYLKIGNQYAHKYPFLTDVSGYYNSLRYVVNGQTDLYSEGISKALGKLKKYRFKASYEIQAMILQNLSIVKLLLDDQKESMRLLTEEAIPNALKSKNSEIISDLYKHVGIALMNVSDRLKANEYLQKAVNEIEKATYSPVLLESKIELYIVSAENLLYLDKNAEGKKMLQKAYDLLNPFPKSNLNGLYYYADGLFFYKTERYDLALKSYEKGIENCIVNHDDRSMNRLKFVKYQALVALEYYQKAKEVLGDLLKTQQLLAVEKKKFYNEMAWILEELGEDEKAYDFTEKYIFISDSLMVSQTKNQILALETKFNTTEKENKIKELESQKQQALLTAKYNQLHYIVFGLISFILLLTSLFLFKNSKNQRKIAFQKEINYQQNITAFKTQKELEVMQAMIGGEEAERKRIARDLHDGIGSRLSALKMQLQGFVPLEAEAIAHFSNSLSLSIVELRQIAFNLMPEALLKLGLEMALKDLCNTLKTNKVSIVFHANEISPNNSQSHQVTIFRIVQELINNALKHSNCNEIIVDCSQNQELFLITVEDNGNGFDSDAIDSFHGSGLKNIKNRIDLLKGKLEVNATPNKGSVFNITLSFNNFSN